MILMPEAQKLFMVKMTKSTSNILTCHQHILTPTSVTNIDIAPIRLRILLSHSCSRILLIVLIVVKIAEIKCEASQSGSQ